MHDDRALLVTPYTGGHLAANKYKADLLASRSSFVSFEYLAIAACTYCCQHTISVNLPHAHLFMTASAVIWANSA